MKTAIFLSYKGLGSNLLHLSYCHQISKKFGPLKLITLNNKINQILKFDHHFDEVIYLNSYYKKTADIFKLAGFFKKLKLDQIFIFYPSARYFLASKIAGIKKIHHYPLFRKNKLHLVETAKKFTERVINISQCPTETKIHVDKQNLGIKKNNNFKSIILGIGSSGPTTKWGYEKYISLINHLNERYNLNFYLLCGSNETDGANKIINSVNKKNVTSLSNKDIEEVLHYINICDLYIGNDSFGHHISSQLGKPSFILLLDTPRAYSDYSKNQIQIIPKGYDINKITHDTKVNPNLISVEMILLKIQNFI
ncbi:lipopolysaccharide heptosyltransferase family protein [Candidatus Pelagibacter sp.]|nr:lipopolysaccharide heptosyltransferase family protein [Candidatus Pelagibacter sp.]